MIYVDERSSIGNENGEHCNATTTTDTKIQKSTTFSQAFLPEKIRPFRKAAPKKASQTRRVRRRSAILTDTPQKKKIEDTGIIKNKKKVSLKTKGQKKIRNTTDTSGEEESFSFMWNNIQTVKREMGSMLHVQTMGT